MFMLRAMIFAQLLVGCLHCMQSSSDVEVFLSEIDKRGQFGNVKLGEPLNTSFTELAEQNRVFERRSYDSEGVTWYRHAESPTQLDGSALRYVYYGFKDNQLVEIAIAFKVQKDVKANTRFFERLEKQFNGTRVNHEMWVWSGDKVGLDFSGYCGLDTCSLSYLYIFPKSRVAKSTAKDESSTKQLGELDPPK